MTDASQSERNRVQAAQAAAIYRASIGPESGREAWQAACDAEASAVEATLAATQNLATVESALRQSAGHLRVLRSLMAPPASQDQYALAVPAYSKSAESTARKLAAEKAEELALDFAARRDRVLTSWLDQQRPPTQEELAQTFARAVTILAQQALSTGLRNNAADRQERNAIAILTASGWQEASDIAIAEPSDLPERHFARKARVKAGLAYQEVDIACRLKGGYLLAMECKVTNDTTNSTKRINDIVKKANAWRAEFGTRVKTAALLQGVIKPADVDRLSELGIHVFWSHDLDVFGAWIEAQA
jgi:hypothetical protein